MNGLLIAVFIIIFIVLAAVLVLSVIHLPSKPLTPETISVQHQFFMGNLPWPDSLDITVNIVELNENTTLAFHYAPETFNQIKHRWKDYRMRFVSSIENFFNKTKTADIKAVYIERGHEIIVLFNATNKIWLSNKEYTADFLWLLTPLGLDFIENGFKEYNDKLTWSDVINGEEVNVTVLLPPQNTTYKAWGSPVGHCHGHVWWPAR